MSENSDGPAMNTKPVFLIEYFCSDKDIRVVDVIHDTIKKNLGDFP